jgi:hypothetical protein
VATEECGDQYRQRRISNIKISSHASDTKKYNIDMLHKYTKGCSDMLKYFGLVLYVL